MMNQTKNGKKNIGFYIALAVCIATVAAAAWTTYGSIVGQDDTSQDVGVDHEISGQAYEVDDSSEQETEPSKEEVSAQESQGSAVSEDADDEEEETTPTVSNSNSRGAQIAAYATQFVGNPYVYGGASLTGGADCSGFTMAVFANFGIGLPHNAAAQSGCGRSVSLSDLQPGDLLFYDNGGGIGHVTLYIGGGQVVHASSPETGIKISAYNYRTPVCAVRCW